MDPLVYLLMAFLIAAGAGALIWRIRSDDTPRVL